MNGQVRLIGYLEILGAIGLLLPGLFGELPLLNPLAAAGLILSMIGGKYHIYRAKNLVFQRISESDGSI